MCLGHVSSHPPRDTSTTDSYINSFAGQLQEGHLATAEVKDLGEALTYRNEDSKLALEYRDILTGEALDFIVRNVMNLTLKGC